MNWNILEENEIEKKNFYSLENEWFGMEFQVFGRCKE